MSDRDFKRYFDGPGWLTDLLELRWNEDLAHTVYLYGGLKERIEDMAAKRGRKAAINEVAAKLQEAIKFLSLAQKTSGNVQANHIWFQGGIAVAFDGVIAAGCRIEGLDWTAYPNTKLLSEALSHVGKDMDLTVIEDKGITIKSGDYEAVVPAGDRGQLIPTMPDQPTGPLRQSFIVAMELAGRLVSDTAENFRDAAIYSNGQTLIATNGAAAIEAWHGHSLPVGPCMPKALANVLAKVGKEPTSIGFGAETVTVYFADGSWLRGQLYRERYPENVPAVLDKLMQAPGTVEPPPGLFDAIEAVMPFDPAGLVLFVDGKVCGGHNDTEEGWAATKDVAALADGVMVPGKFPLLYRNEIKTIWLGDPADDRPRMVFMGGDSASAPFRAVVGGSDGGRPATTAPEPAAAVPSWGAGAPAAADPAPSWGNAPAPAAAPSPAPLAAPVSDGWGSASAIINADPPNVSAPAPLPASGVTSATYPSDMANGNTLPYTPRSRRWGDDLDNPGWNTYPYTLKPGETIEQFMAEAPPNPTQVAPGTSAGATYAAQAAPTPAPSQVGQFTQTVSPSEEFPIIDVPWGPQG